MDGTGPHAKDAKGAKVDEAPNDLRLAHSGSEQSLAQGGGAGQFCRPMNANSQTSHTENQLSKIILDAAFKVHTKSGPGLLVLLC